MFKNKFVGIFVAVTVFAVVFYTVLGLMGATSPFHSVLGTVSTPFRAVLSWAGDAISGFGDYFTEYGRLADENERLADRVAELEQKNAHAEVLEGENEWLREFLSVEEYLTDYTLVDASVIGRESNSYRTVYTLGKGALHGIKVDMAVVSPMGIVGRVESVSATSCTVSVITEDTGAVGAVCARSGVRGVVRGSLGLRGDGLCSMDFIDESADVQVGDVILSSGSGSVYPYGFIIGTVVELRADTLGRTYSAIVKPSVDFESVTRVMILKKTEVSEKAETDTPEEVSP